VRDKTEALGAGADDYIVKPLVMKDLRTQGYVFQQQRRFLASRQRDIYHQSGHEQYSWNPVRIAAERRTRCQSPQLQREAPKRFNTFGGSLGGPARIPKLYNGKDKTLFFVDYEGNRKATSEAGCARAHPARLFYDAGTTI
jgi:hypothetical protein